MSLVLSVSYCDLWSVLMDYVALSLKIWKLGGHPGLVAYGNVTKGIGSVAIVESLRRGKGPSSAAIGTWQL